MPRFTRAYLPGVGGGDSRNTGGLLGVFIALGLVSWLTVARLVRGQVLSLKEKEFIEAARVTGATNGRIIFRHRLPNTLAPVIAKGSAPSGRSPTSCSFRRSSSH
jgi:glutathione transport system permease protein